MLRKGRCSNLPEKCNNAKDGTLLPFAGVGSLCPECNAPLALVAVEEPNVTEASTSNQYNSPPQQVNYENSNQYGEKPSNKALSWTINLALIFLIAGGVFFGLKHFNKNGGETINISNSSISDDISVNAFNPPKIGRAIHDIQGRSEPSEEAGTNIGLIAEGTAVDITGEVIINNIPWLRIAMPNQSTQVGYVKKSDIQNLGEGIEVVAGGLTNEITNTTGAIVSQITPISEQLYYVTSTRANIRQEAGANAPKIGEMLRGDTLLADASQIVDGKTWFRVKLPNGNIGWISSTLLSLNVPPPIPVQPVLEPMPEVEVPNSNQSSIVSEGDNIVISSVQANVRSKPVVDDSTIVSRADKGMVLQVQEVLSTNGQTWYHVRSNRFGIDGWISSSTARVVDR